jgi:putative addiction module killer protein
VYFGRDGDVLVILLTGGTKRRQQRDIETAKALWADYKRRRPKAR